MFRYETANLCARALLALVPIKSSHPLEATPSHVGVQLFYVAPAGGDISNINIYCDSPEISVFTRDKFLFHRQRSNAGDPPALRSGRNHLPEFKPRPSMHAQARERDLWVLEKCKRYVESVCIIFSGICEKVFVVEETFFDDRTFFR